VTLQSIEDFQLGLAHFMVQRIIELDYAESWNYGCDRYPDYDIITRRYLAYCLESGQNIEDCVDGLKQGDIEDN